MPSKSFSSLTKQKSSKSRITLRKSPVKEKKELAEFDNLLQREFEKKCNDYSSDERSEKGDEVTEGLE